MFDDYLDRIDASDVIRERVEKLYAMFTSLIPAERVPHILIENDFDQESNERFTSLWLYGPEYVTEFHGFQTQEKFDGVVISKVHRWEVTAKNFTIGKNAGARSRLGLVWSASGGVSAAMSALGANCEQLSHFFETVILPKHS